MGGEHGVKNAGLVLDVVAEGGNVAEKMVKASGTVAKLSELSGLLDEGMALMALDSAELVKELKELDDADIAALKERFKTKFDLTDDRVEGLVEEGLDIAQLYGQAIAKNIAWVQKLKAPAPAPAPEAPAAAEPAPAAPSA